MYVCPASPSPFNTICINRGKHSPLASRQWHAVVGRAHPLCAHQKDVPRSQLSGWEPNNCLNFFTINVYLICQCATLKSSSLSLSLCRGKQSDSCFNRLVYWNLAIFLIYSLVREVTHSPEHCSSPSFSLCYLNSPFVSLVSLNGHEYFPVLQENTCLTQF